MDFTREPIIESILTPKEGCKLVVRSSKSAGQEEYFVDAIEIVSFGNTFFYRSLERPKSFLVPATDYEIVEVREARMVLKHVGVDRSIKIGGGAKKKKAESEKSADETSKRGRTDKKKERRRQQRKKREKGTTEEEAGKVELPAPSVPAEAGKDITEKLIESPDVLSSLLPPPPKLISETISKYKEDDVFKEVFVEEATEAVEEAPEPSESPESPEAEDSMVEEQEISVPEPEEALQFGSLESETAEADEVKDSKKE